MKISTKSQTLTDRIVVFIGFAGLVFMWFSFSDLNWVYIIMGGLVAGISFLVVKKRIHNRVDKFAEKLIGDFGVISKVDKTGFKFSRMDDTTNEKLYQWSDLQKISLENETDLVFKYNNDSEEVIKRGYVGYYKLLKNIPVEKLTDPKVKAYQKNAFENLETCKICGFIAVKNKECSVCGVENFEKTKELGTNHLTEKDFLIEEQLEHFSTDDVGRKVEFYPGKEPDGIFEFDKDWKPIVSEKEVLEFSKENYWD